MPACMHSSIMSRKIPKEHYHRGIVLCWRNSRRLLKLCDEAFSKECYLASYLLGFAAWEEVGKATVILNHWNEEHIKYKEYLMEVRNHKFKITEADKLEVPNLVEILRLTTREALLDWEYFREPNLIELNKFLNLRLDSVHVNYNFDGHSWEVPRKDMKQNALDVMVKAAYARTYLYNELKHRGIRLRKKKTAL